MDLRQAKSNWSANRKPRRIGRGEASGWGKTGGKGHKGAKARSGSSVKMTWQGGATPLFRRIPKIGFTNARYKKTYRTINVSVLEALDANAEVTAELLLEKGLIKKGSDALKILGNGEITKALKVKAAKFTESAKQKIEAAGGSCEEV